MGEFIPIVAIVMTFSVPLVAILVTHQRKMAEMIHRNHAQAMQVHPETDALRREVAELKHLMLQQTIALDDMRGRIASQDLSQRVSG
ncbi:MAG TPA: hypothetical protein PLX06_05390 [Fimbriimonadaceae bacterium]|nr:hypothetical protein [Fimbriimonadaceae bacterium]